MACSGFFGGLLGWLISWPGLCICQAGLGLGCRGIFSGALASNPLGCSILLGGVGVVLGSHFCQGVFASVVPEYDKGCGLAAFGLVCFLRRVDFVNVLWESRELWLLGLQWSSVVILEVMGHDFLMGLFDLSMFLGGTCCPRCCRSASFGVLLTGVVFS